MGGARTFRGSSSQKTRHAPATLRRVLVVDEDANAADALVLLVRSTGYGDARAAYTGASALAQAVEFRATVLMVNLDLPDANGYQVALELSQHPQLRGLRIVALTASSDHPDRELARQAGIERYLSTPVGPSDLDKVFPQLDERQ